MEMFIPKRTCEAIDRLRTCESRPEEAAETPGIGRPDAKMAPMSDERLAEIEAIAQMNGWISPEIVVAMTEEIRRLKRALALSEASRGVPNLVGGD